LSLRLYPDSVLRQICAPVERFDSELRDLVNEMRSLIDDLSIKPAGVNPKDAP